MAGGKGNECRPEGEIMPSDTEVREESRLSVHDEIACHGGEERKQREEVGGACLLEAAESELQDVRDQFTQLEARFDLLERENDDLRKRLQEPSDRGVDGEEEGHEGHGH